MESAQDQVSAAIGAVVSRFRTMVRSVGARRGLLEPDLDEVLQDVRIRLWQAEQSGKDIQALGSSYLYQVASSAALDLLRRRRARGGSRTDEISERDDLVAAAPSPHDEVEALDVARQIEEAVESLPADRRVAVRFHLAGYDRHDIARALGWTEPRARNLLYRGLNDVRRRLTLKGIRPTRVQ